MLSKQKNAEELYIMIQADEKVVEVKNIEEEATANEKPIVETASEEFDKHENPYVDSPKHHE